MDTDTYGTYVDTLVEDAPNALCWLWSSVDKDFEYASELNAHSDVTKNYTYEEKIKGLRQYIHWSLKNGRNKGNVELAEEDIRFGIQMSLNNWIQIWKQEHPEVEDKYDALVNDAYEMLAPEILEDF